jgi:hypothetical protein
MLLSRLAILLLRLGGLPLLLFVHHGCAPLFTNSLAQGSLPCVTSSYTEEQC